LTKDNVVVVCGEANTVRKHKLSKRLKYIKQFVQSRINTNIVIMSAPCRFQISCVNKEVKVFGINQQKMAKLFINTGIINMGSFKEKEWITNKTAEIIKKNSRVKSWFI
jgi:translation initiation factor 2 gamma subunit (eIF-2gamma)